MVEGSSSPHAGVTCWFAYSLPPCSDVAADSNSIEDSNIGNMNVVCRAVVTRSKNQPKVCFPWHEKPAKPALDFLEEEVSQTITVINGHLGLIEVDAPFPTSNIHKWTLQDSPAWVWPEGQHYRVESDLVLISGQTLTCTIAIQDEQSVHDRLAGLWTPRWNRHVEVPEEMDSDHWFCSGIICPHNPLDLPAISFYWLENSCPSL